LSGLRRKSAYGFQKQCLDALDLLVGNGAVTMYSVEASGRMHIEGRRNNTHAEACGFLSLEPGMLHSHAQEMTCVSA
jgi:hypothetical protein